MNIGMHWPTRMMEGRSYVRVFGEVREQLQAEEKSVIAVGRFVGR